MRAFLIITTFSLAFYLGLLVFLYRDGLKRRYGAPSVYNVQARSVAELGLPRAFDTVRSPRRQNAASVLVRFADNPGRGRLKTRAIQGNSAKVIILPRLARDNDDALCG
jgi:hypothetical protein